MKPAQLITWAAGRVALGVLITLLVWRIWQLEARLAYAAIGALLLWITAVLVTATAATRREPCMICGTNYEVLPIPTGKPPPWWSLGMPAGNDLDWVCENHLITYLRLRNAGK